MPQFVCDGCNKLITVDRQIRDGERCAICSFSQWRNHLEPIKPYKLSENDRIFLRVNRIIPEV